MLKYLRLLLLPLSSFAFTLITFDVDGTLVRGSGEAAAKSAHALAFAHAVGQVLGGGTSITPVAEALPRRSYEGSTDGLILLRLARATLGIEPSESFPQLDSMMDCMYEYINQLDNAAIAAHIAPLPGVLDHLNTLSKMQDQVLCGLVTGNVEGIARRKMEAVGIWETRALSPPCETQKIWYGTEHLGFLGGFGSDYCSGDIDNLDRNYLDRGEQIAIATKRCRNKLGEDKTLKRVVHVGDAPSDVLAAKTFSEQNADANLCVGMVAVATGSYHADELRELAGEPIPGQWEPVILDDGMADPHFLAACGL
jgi:phosphoglycolate phosphatase-like HAD superfamily hydrolase